MTPALGRTTAVLAAVGAASLLFGGASLGKLLVALGSKTDFGAAFLPAPPRGAFKDKVFWITGASSGIGRRLALHLCANHDDVKLILSSRRNDALEEVRSECEKARGATARVEARVLTVDLAHVSSLPSKAKKALSTFGRVDVLVNNGGVTTRSMARNSDIEVDGYVANVDYLSYVALAKSLLPSWEDRADGSDRPIVINTSSVSGKISLPVRTAYCGAKFAIHGWFDAFRLEQVMVGHPVNVLNVVLGSTKTNVARNAVVESPDVRFGDTDENIEGGLDPSFVAERVLASAYAGIKELWIARPKELLSLYLNRYIPETFSNIVGRTMMKQYAVEKGKELSEGEL